MSFRAIQRNIKCRAFSGRNIQISLPVNLERSSYSALAKQATSGPSRRTQAGSNDNAAVRLDASLKTPTVHSPRCSLRSRAQ